MCKRCHSSLSLDRVTTIFPKSHDPNEVDNNGDLVQSNDGVTEENNNSATVDNSDLTDNEDDSVSLDSGLNNREVMAKVMDNFVDNLRQISEQYLTQVISELVVCHFINFDSELANSKECPN